MDSEFYEEADIIFKDWCISTPIIEDYKLWKENADANNWLPSSFVIPGQEQALRDDMSQNDKYLEQPAEAISCFVTGREIENLAVAKWAEK